jgi:N-acetylmuramoyl-L-alanine amidase
LIKNKKTLIIIATIIILFAMLIYSLKNTTSNKEIKDLTEHLFEDIQSDLVSVTKYIVYGTHLNISGRLDTSLLGTNIAEVKLVLKNIEGFEIPFVINYTIDEKGILFNTSDEINSGINLEEINIGDYYILLKVVSTSGDISSNKYYLLNNQTEYENIEYYTITKNNGNNKIDISSGKYLLNGIMVSYMNLEVQGSKLPDDIYDIVIDPGHGGNDCGAINGDYTEAEIVLEYCLSLKDKLDELGLKVKLVRDEDEYIDVYGEEGRGVIPNQVKAKYVFSVHLNSSSYVMNTGGVEIYSPPNSNLSFSKLIADNIVNIAKTTYSPNRLYRIQDGVYVRNYIEEEIIDAKECASESGYKAYNITTATPYMFMIRETGGIATNAYIDGRNKEYGANKYYNSNIGVEGYLLELGFLTCAADLSNILNNKKLYVSAIAKSIQEYLHITN